MIKYIALFLFVTAAAHAEIIEVMGQPVDARDISYYNDSPGKIHRFTPVTSATFTMARQNRFTTSSTVYLTRDGEISAIFSDQPYEFEWSAPDGRGVQMDCGVKQGAFGPLARAVSFHPNGEYSSGCTTIGVVGFDSAQVANLQVSGDFDVDRDFNLLYAQKVSSGRLSLGEEAVGLFPGSEIAFHSSGRVRFFTMVHRASFGSSHPFYGELRFTQKEGRHTSTVLAEDGSVERGILAAAVSDDLIGTIPAGSGIVFSKPSPWPVSRITAALFAQPVTYAVQGGYQPLISKWLWDTDSGLYTVEVAAAFKFTNPETYEVLTVPVGSQLILNPQRKIIAIQIK